MKFIFLLLIGFALTAKAQYIPADWVVWPITHPNTPTVLGTSFTTDSSINTGNGFFLATSNAPTHLPLPIKMRDGSLLTDTNTSCFAYNHNVSQSYVKYTFPSAASNISFCVMGSLAPGSGSFNDAFYFVSAFGYTEICQMDHDGNPNLSYFRVHGSGGTTTTGAAIYYTNNTQAGAPSSYMLTGMYQANPGGTNASYFEASLYNADTWQQVMSIYSTTTNFNVPVIGFWWGNEGHGGTGNNTDYWGAMVISTNVYPRSYGVPYVPPMASMVPTNYINPSHPWFGMVGVDVGPITNRTVFTNVVGIDGSGSIDVTAAIQNCINLCPSNQAVALPAGKFAVTTISLTNGVTLEGGGMGTTKLIGISSSNTAIVTASTTGNAPATGNDTAINSGSVQGSTNVTLASTNGFAVGKLVMFTELNNQLFVNTNGDNGACTFCDGGQYGGARSMGQICTITNVSGSTISFYPPLFQNYTNTPQATPFSASCSYAGLESLTLVDNNTGYSENLQFRGTQNCWMRNVECDYTGGDYFQISWGFRNTVEDCYFHDAYVHSAGASTDGDGFLINKSSCNLINRNLGFRVHAGYMMNWGTAGNAIVYNFSTNAFASDAVAYDMEDVQFHGAHPQMNLIEGNSVRGIRPDSVHGSSSHNTIFNNQISGGSFVWKPYTGRGDLDLTSGFYPYQAIRCIDLCNNNNYFSIYGNILGSAIFTFGSNSSTFKVVSPTTRTYQNAAYIYTVNYTNTSDTGSGQLMTLNPISNTVYTINFDVVNNGIQYSTNVPSLIPQSLIYTNKPAGYGNGNWPPFDPTSTNPSQVTNLLAYQRYVSLQLPAGPATGSGASSVRGGTGRAAGTGHY